MTSTSPLVRIHTSTNSAWRKQVSRRVPFRVPRARRSARSSPANSSTSSRGTSNMARYAINVGSSAGLDLVEENSLPRTPRPSPYPHVTGVSGPHPADLVEITSVQNHIVAVPLELHHWILPDEPGIQRVVQKEIRQQRGDRRALRSPFRRVRTASVRVLHRGQ